MNNVLKPLRTLFTAIGGALPAANPLHRGVFAVKKATATEDELHVGLRDSSDVMQWRRMLTKTYGDTLYGPLSSSHAAATVADTASIDLTLTGQQISAAAIFGTSSTTVAQGDHLHDSTYVNVTGDTMTGPLIVDTDSSTSLRVLSDATTPFSIEDSDATMRVRFSGSANRIVLANGTDIIAFSDNESTQKLNIDGATGDIDTEGKITLGSAGVQILTGTGDPESVHTAVVGSLFLRTDGGTGTSLYVKESGSGNTGWSSAA
jgi:hypothetical protein